MRHASLLAAALLCVAGCSTPLLRSMPFPADAPVALAGTDEGRVNLWPFFSCDSDGVSMLWPLMSFNTRDHENRIFPVFWGDHYFTVFPVLWTTGDSFVVFPLIWVKDSWQGVLPVFWWNNGFTVFPLVWYGTESPRTVARFYFHAFPLWLHSSRPATETRPAEHETHVLWPVVRVVNEENEKGWRVWPFVGTSESKTYPGGPTESYTYALWPLCHFRKEGNEVTRVVAPFYFEQSGKDESWWTLLPLIYRARNGPDSLTLTPLWSAGSKGDAHWSALVPLYYQSEDPKAQTRRLVTPLLGRYQSPDKTGWTLVPLGSSLAWGKGEKDLWLLGPLAHARWGGDKVQHHVAPLYYYDREERLLLTPLVSWQNKPDEGFVNVAGPLAHYTRSGSRRTLDFLWPFGQAAWQPGEGLKETYLFPLFWWERRHDETNCAVLIGLYNQYRSSATRTVEGREVRRECRVSRVLWRAMRYRRFDDGEQTLDVFPFITWRRQADGGRSFSFLWRFYRNARTADGGRNLDLLFIPVLRAD